MEREKKVVVFVEFSEGEKMRLLMGRGGFRGRGGRDGGGGWFGGGGGWFGGGGGWFGGGWFGGFRDEGFFEEVVG